MFQKITALWVQRLLFEAENRSRLRRSEKQRYWYEPLSVFAPKCLFRRLLRV